MGKVKLFTSFKENEKLEFIVPLLKIKGLKLIFKALIPLHEFKSKSSS